MPERPLRTRLTVASLTPACFAMSASFPATLQVYVDRLQEHDRAGRARPRGSSARDASLRRVPVSAGQPRAPVVLRESVVDLIPASFRPDEHMSRRLER